MLDTSKLQNFGIEIETVGLSRAQLADVIVQVTGGTLSNRYDYTVTLADGRIWSVVPDGSLQGAFTGEIVSPILTYADMGTLQNVVRAVRAAGGSVNESCGVHVHVGSEKFDALGLIRLVNLFHKQEATLTKAFGVSAYRLAHYCWPVNAEFIARLDSERPTTMARLSMAWYGPDNYRAPSRYNGTRYHGLNLNSHFNGAGIEFRHFQGTLHAGEIKAYVQLCLAMVDRALTVKSTQRARRIVPTGCEKWTMRLFMKTLGMTGPEFATARAYFMKRLAGSTDNPGRVLAAVASRDVQAIAVPALQSTGLEATG